MNKILNKTKEHLLSIYIIINLLYILVGSILNTKYLLRYDTFSYGYIGLFAINILIILILFIKKKYNKNKIDIFLILIIIFAGISTIFAYKPEKALFGEFYRYEGLFTILYYISIFFLTSFIKKGDRKKIIYFILILGLIHAVYAILQKFNILYTDEYKGELWARGLTINPNFFGTVMTLCISYSIGLFFDSNDKLKEVFYLFLTYIYYIGMLLSNSLCNVVGLFAVLIILFIYSLKKGYIKKYIILCLALLFTLIFIHLLGMTHIVSDIIKTKNETTNIVKGDFNNEYGTGRVELWKKTIPIIPKYLLHGVGIDNFKYVLNGKPIWRVKSDGYRGSYDKAHNEYLQILVTMGIFSLISYLCMHFIIVKNGIVNTFKNREIYYILPVIGYLVQAQFNISVIEVAPIFYIALGLLIDRNN